MFEPVLKAKNFEADDIEKTEFTEVNEYFEIEILRRNSKILKLVKIKSRLWKDDFFHLVKLNPT